MCCAIPYTYIPYLLGVFSFHVEPVWYYQVMPSFCMTHLNWTWIFSISEGNGRKARITLKIIPTPANIFAKTPSVCIFSGILDQFQVWQKPSCKLGFPCICAFSFVQCAADTRWKEAGWQKRSWKCGLLPPSPPLGHGAMPQIQIRRQIQTRMQIQM